VSVFLLRKNRLKVKVLYEESFVGDLLQKAVVKNTQLIKKSYFLQKSVKKGLHYGFPLL